ncbi:MAG: DNA topoisomerase I [archaeon]|nr:DNA topoisomerase I [archaeon]
MKIIVTEKAIAGNRIAGILSAGKYSQGTLQENQVFEFEKKGEKFTVVPLRGHIVDVDFPKSYSYWLGTDLRKLVNAPIEYIEKEKKIIRSLREAGKTGTEVIIATDADREGESIGVEALRFIQESNPKIKIHRAYFSALTEKDVTTAFDSLSKLDYNFADSADSRREIDLAWGAVLTRYLSLVSGQLGKEFLSAGRVQTPVLALIVNREKERLAFRIEKYWVISALFEKDKKEFIGEHREGKFWDKKKAEEVLAKKDNKGIVEKIVKKKKTLARPTPFNTTEFLRSATAIGLTAGDAMSVAESLYQQGFISYPRTDNTVFPKTIDLREVLAKIASVKEFSALAGKILAKKELVPSRGPKESKDHPPIYPSGPAKKETLSDKQWKVYELVVRRFLAVLSEDAETDNQTVTISVKGEPFVAHGQTITREGWKEFYPYSKISETILPEMKEGDIVDVKKIELLEKETQPPARYSQSSLIKLMDDLGLGTKSTRHEIIQKLYARHYISGLKAIEPNKIAFAVIDSLTKYARAVTEPKMTADLETEMDEVAAGKKTKQEVVNDSTQKLGGILGELLEKKNDIGSEMRKALQADSIMGDCDKCQTGKLRKLKSKNAKWFLACNNYPSCKNTYPLPQKGKIIPLDKKCGQCKKPMIKVIGQRFRYEMCVDMNCPSKADWGKKKEKTAEAKTA